MTRQWTTAAIVGLIIVTSLGTLGGFPAATAVALMLAGIMVILMMTLADWP
jgi:hypothetical protein